MTDNDKYIVFKAAEFAAWHDENVSHLMESPPRPLTDAVVIRLQDVFAEPGLSAYAMAIQTGIDMRAMAIPMHDNTTLINDLGEIRDFFMDQAREAHDYPIKKIPD